MKLKLLCVITGLFVSCFACSSVPVKKHPDYKGVDKRAVKIVNEYKELAKKHNVKFTKNVTVGYTTINREDVVGLCTWSDQFREIDIDQPYWDRASDVQKHALLFHELTHCYCSRIHDYAEGKEYPDKPLDRLKDAVNWKKNGGERPGYMDDGCPTSLMYPSVIDEVCYLVHQDEYFNEMFTRCTPW